MPSLKKTRPQTSISATGPRSRRLDQWELLLDPKNRRDPAAVSEKEWKSAHRVRVPHVWEQIQPGHDGVGWYRHFIEVKDDAKGKRVHRLRISAAHYRADVFLNGKFLRRHDGGYTPFVAELGKALRPGINELLVRVVDPPREYEVEGLQSSHPLRQTVLPTYKAGWYYSFGGFWQPVHLLETGATWLEDAFIQPRLDPRSIKVDYTLGGRVASDVRLDYRVTAWKKTQVLAQGQVTAAGNSGSFECPLPNAPLWSCEQPNLLELHVTLTADGVSDERSWRFGLREFTTDGKKFLLNGKPIFLRGVLHQGGFPETLVFPKDAAMARKDVQSILDAGCNLSRITLRPASPAELDLCDELGLLVIGEPPIGWIAHDKDTDRRCLQEVEEMIRRDRNRPAVIMWTLLNEFTDTVYYRHKDPTDLIRTACRLGVELDPTRLMSGNSGTAAAAGEDIANGIFGQNKGPFPIQDEHIYLRNFPSRKELEDRMIRVGEGKEGLVFVSEFGTSAFPDLDAALARYTPAQRRLGLEDYQQMKNYRDEVVKGWKDLGLSRHFPTLKAFYHALGYDQAEMVRLEQRALRLNSRNSGYVITQGADASSEYGGIVDLWREPKRVYSGFRDLNRDKVLLVDIPALYCFAGESLPVKAVISNFSGDEAVCRGKVSVRFGNRETKAWNFRGASDWSRELSEKTVKFDRPGKWTVRAEAVCGREPVAETQTVTALRRPDFAGRRILLMDSLNGPHGGVISELGERLGTLGLSVAKYANQDNAANVPAVVHLRGRDRALNYFEKQAVLRREVEAGRNAIFIDCDLAYLHYFFGEEIPREIYGNGAYAGNMGFAFDPQIFKHLGPELQIGPAYGSCYPRILPEAFRVRKQGGEVLAVHAMPYQFGRPDTIDWGASLYRQRFGKGTIWVCAFRLFEAMEQNDPVSLELFSNLLAAAEKP